VKILDKYLLKSFLTTFTSVFVILFFIFVLQVVWLFISELAGKDLDIYMIIKFLLFKMPSVIPLVLPLSVVLASIMTFGSFAENYEFAAMKSAGISLKRTMRSLTLFILFLSLITFIFANNVIPYAEYKFINFRRNIAQVKPAMAIAEGQFSDVGAYNIKVEKKSGKNGKYLSQVTIHKKSILGSGSNTVIKAKKGELVSSENSNVLKLVLNDGNYYEDIIPAKYEDRMKLPFAKSEFKRYVINIDLSKLNSADMNDEQITNTNTMLTVGELKYTLDSLQKNYKKDLISISENINQRGITNYLGNTTNADSPTLNMNNLLQGFSETSKTQIIRIANSNIDGTIFSLESSRFEIEEKQKNINLHWIALYDKFVITFSCFLMFFIGAPLGAIIRKGGLGLPIVFAILIFIIFHFINTFGKKVAQEGGISPFLGCWMSTMVLAPLAIILTKRATDDKGFSINFDWLTNIFNSILPSNEEQQVRLQTVTTNFVTELKIEDRNAYIETDSSSKTNKYKTSEPPSKKNQNIFIAQIAQQYNLYSLLALLSNIGLLFVSYFGIPETLLLKIITVVIALIFFFTVWKSQQLLKTITEYNGKTIEIPLFIIVTGGFPFYFLFYIFNRIYVNQLDKSPNTKV